MNKNISISELVMALRCSARPKKQGDSCVDCPYRVLEEITDELFEPDEIIEGVSYWESCDVDQIVLDAADIIEKLNEIPMR